MSQSTTQTTVKIVGSITLKVFDNGTAEAIVENPGHQLQASPMRCIPPLIREASIKPSQEVPA